MGIRGSLGARLTVDQAIRLERFAHKYIDVKEFAESAKDVKEFVESVNDILKEIR